MSERPIVLAFPSGGIDYDCPNCGRCCRGLGMGGLPDQLIGHDTLVQLAPFTATESVAGPMLNLFTYADGCRHQAADNLCDLHRAHGPESKPLICRLFPFSKFIEVEGVWFVLPHHGCPWTAGTNSELSHHDAIMELLPTQHADELTPERWEPLTSMEPQARAALEESIRDRACGASTIHAALSASVELTKQAGFEAWQEPGDTDLWIDILRCAGQPSELADADQRLFVAALPALRVALMPHVPVEAIPVALSAFNLWLRSLAELGEHRLTGEDLLHLLEQSLPLVRILSLAERPLPRLQQPDVELEPTLAALVPELEARVGRPTGLTLLELLQPFDRGALPLLMQIGQYLL